MRRIIHGRRHPRLWCVEVLTAQTELLVHRLCACKCLATAAATRAPTPAPRSLRLRRHRLARVPALHPPASMCTPELEVFDVPSQLHVQDRVLRGLLARRDEDLALAECDNGEHDEHRPCQAHQDRHDDVPDVKERRVEGVADLAKGKDPAHCLTELWNEAKLRKEIEREAHRWGKSGTSIREYHSNPSTL